MDRSFSGIAASALLVLPLWLAPPAAYSAGCGVPSTNFDLPIAPAEASGIDRAKLCVLTETLSAPDSGIHAVLVLRHGHLIYEEYLSGRDSPWGKEPGKYAYDAKTLHDVRSITKSVVSLLVGIAHDRGLIADLDASIFDYLPQYADLLTSENAGITVAHLLSMTSGFVANEDVAYASASNTERLMNEAADPFRYAIGREMMSQPGGTFRYDGGNTMLLSAILQRATGEPLVDFAREALFAPLGIAEFDWIPLRKSGEVAAQGSLRLRPRDLARIGQLVLDKGRWHGKQVVPEAWIAESTAGRIDGWHPDQYGYQWWVGTSATAGRPATGWIAGVGIGGQRLFIVPTLCLVVVINGWVPVANQRAAMMDIFEKHVLDAVRD